MSSPCWLQQILPELRGLVPRAWLCVGAGYSREEAKAEIFRGGAGFVADAVQNPTELALRIFQASRLAADRPRASDPMLSPLGRQEALREILASPGLRGKFPELRKLARQSGYLKRIDSALQRGRMAFAHADEEQVYCARLGVDGKDGAQVRDELRGLAAGFEAWMLGKGYLDPPALLEAAREALETEGWPAELAPPERIHWLAAQAPESRERAFWDELGRHVEVSRPDTAAPTAPARAWRWEQWHTLDDAADALAERLVGEGSRGSAVLFADSASARRSLRRALADRGLRLADPRDPMQLKTDEALKRALMPLELVARRFECRLVVEWLARFRPALATAALLQEIHNRAFRGGLAGYRGGALAPVHAELARLEDRLGGKRRCAELARAHLAWLAREGQDTRFLEAAWKSFDQDLGRVDARDRAAPALFWLERLRERIAQTPAPVERLKPEEGVDAYRLSQAPLRATGRLYVLGLGADWLTAERVGDDWFSERDRERLGSEFAVRSGPQAARDRAEGLRAWLAPASEVIFLDARYDPDGRERESIRPVLQQAAAALPAAASLATAPADEPPADLFAYAGAVAPAPLVPESPREMGAHPRWRASYRAARVAPPQTIELPPLPNGPDGSVPHISATALDRYTRCPMQALAFHRWRLKDLREPDTELWADARGRVLHAAVRALMESRDADGAFLLTPRQALEGAWELERPRGLLSGPALREAIEARLIQIIEAFCDKERQYAQRSRTRPIVLDDRSFSLSLGPVTVVGTPDRVDEHEDGVFVMDYKTSSSLPKGLDMVELGYRQQLPFYALAVQKELAKPVLGVQFIHLGRQGNRNTGMLFKRYNGKEEGKLTQIGATSKSLLAMDPNDAWAQVETAMRLSATLYVQGHFEARPRSRKPEEECAACQTADLCGLRRIVGSGDDAEVPQ